MSEHHEQFVRALALLQMDGLVAVRRGRGRPAHDRAKVARAFLARPFSKPQYASATGSLGARRGVASSVRLGDGGANRTKRFFASVCRVRAQRSFLRSACRAGTATQSERLVGHPAGLDGHPKYREKPRIARRGNSAMTRLERQCSGTMTVEQMLAELPQKCDVGCKLDSRGTNIVGLATNSTWTWPMDKFRSVVC